MTFLYVVYVCVMRDEALEVIFLIFFFLQEHFEAVMQRVIRSPNFQILWPGCKKRQKTIEHKVEIGDISGSKVFAFCCYLVCACNGMLCVEFELLCA